MSLDGYLPSRTFCVSHSALAFSFPGTNPGLPLPHVSPGVGWLVSGVFASENGLVAEALGSCGHDLPNSGLATR
jgi:hypothetical protein